MIQIKRVSYTIRIALALVFYVGHYRCQALSEVYAYQLYFHNIYYAEPPGLPSNIAIAPIITTVNEATPSEKNTRLFSGTIGSLRLAHKKLWIEFFAGAGKEQFYNTKDGYTFDKRSRSGFDDFLIDCGYNFFLDNAGKNQLIVHALAGIPTYRRITFDEIEHPLLGTRSLNFGPVIEFSHHFIRSKEQDFCFGCISRFLHQCQRKSTDLGIKAHFLPGNTTNLLLLLHYRYHGHHFEAGYNSTFITNRAYRFPSYTKHLQPEQLTSIYTLYLYYSQRLSMAIETGLIGTFNPHKKGFAWFGLISWYF